MNLHPSVDQTAILRNGPTLTAERLESAARMLAGDPAIAGAANLDLELVALVDECLHSCRDGALLQALNGLRHEDQAHRLLQAQVETASASAFVETADGPRVVRLCAIPVLLPSEQLPEHGRLAPGAAFEALSSSIRTAGFIHSEASVAVADYLYHPKELLGLWPSEVYRLPASLLSRAPGTDPGFPLTGLAGLGRTGWPADPPVAGGACGVQLRFLLVTVTEELGVDALLKPWSDEEHERLQVALGDWTAGASSPLARALGLSADQVVVICFAPYAQSLKTGFESLRYVALRTALAPLVEQKSRARDLSVTLELRGDEDEDCCDQDATRIRLLATSSIRDDASSTSPRSLEHHYPVSSPADALASLERVVSVLRDAGVRRIWVVRHPHLDSRVHGPEATPRMLRAGPPFTTLRPPQPPAFDLLAA